jgi:hypothetical protein
MAELKKKAYSEICIKLVGQYYFFSGIKIILNLFNYIQVYGY